MSEEIEDRDKVTMRPLKWKCTNECRNLTSEEVAIVLRTKSPFQMSIGVLRAGLDDLGSECGHVHTDITLKLHSEIIEQLGHPGIYPNFKLHKLFMKCSRLSCPHMWPYHDHSLVLLHMPPSGTSTLVKKSDLLPMQTLSTDITSTEYISLSIYMEPCSSDAISSLPEFPHYPSLLHVGYTSCLD